MAAAATAAILFSFTQIELDTQLVRDKLKMTSRMGGHFLNWQKRYLLWHEHVHSAGLEHFSWLPFWHSSVILWLLIFYSSATFELPR
jgi:hypothetical protein